MPAKNKLLAATLLLAVGATFAALSWVRAQDVASEKQISLVLAQETAAAAIERCRKEGYRVAVTVVDRAGQVKATLRDDGAGPHTADTSRRKAYTALTLRAVTSEVVKRIAANPEAAGLKEVTDVLILGGGIPIRAGTEIIGAVGVSGAPGGDKDEVCGQAGIDKIMPKLK